MNTCEWQSIKTLFTNHTPKSVLWCKAKFGFSFTNIHDWNGEAISSWLALYVYLVSWYVFSIAKSLFTRRLRIVLVFVILTISLRISDSLLGNTRVTMMFLQKCLDTFCLKSLISYFYINQRTPEVLVWLANNLLKWNFQNEVNRR